MTERSEPLPPQPEPRAEPPEPPPGGPHRLEGVGGDGAYSTEGHDPDPRYYPLPEADGPPSGSEPPD